MRCAECGGPIAIVEGMPVVRYGNRHFCKTGCLYKNLRSQRDAVAGLGRTS